MSFQEELEEILRSEFYVNDHDNCDDSCSKKWHSNEAFNRALTSIINLVDKEVKGARKEGKLLERTRWITDIQQKVLTEVSATLSPRITDLINNTELGNGTVQKALKRLIEVKLVRKIDNIYHLYEDSMFMCEFGCKDAGLHYHAGVQSQRNKLRGE